MPNAANLDNVIARINAIGRALTSVNVRSAADYPTESADPFPMMVSFVGNGQARFVNATMLLIFPEINVEFHFSRTNLRQAQKDINATIIEFPRRLAGDPTLAAAIDTVVSDQGQPISFTQRPAKYGEIASEMLLFVIRVKAVQSPLSTP
jgi:hypothetical protein